MDLKECFQKGLVKKVEINEELVKSLIEMSRIKEIAVKEAKINSINISAYVSLAYDSLREALEAACISKGYKVLSHICLGELLKELFKEFEYGEFDRLRWIRNSINYYGTKVEFKQGKEIIKKIFKMKNEVIKKFIKF
ncbi:MAG: hypothetical protein QXK49_02535 [Candidatus Aenigmatarchaeota archaeon]